MGSGWFPDHDKVLNQPPIPPRPQNQKAATMPHEPTLEQVQSFAGMVQVDEDTAKRWLRVKQGNIDAAINAYFDGEDLSKAEKSENWSEDAWHGDREGNMRSLAATAPPSRAPSRAGDRLHPTSRQQEDEDLAAAMANSQQDLAGMQYQQEGGVIGRDGTEINFGPASRSSYDAYSWAMVPTSQTASEVVPDVDAERRRHTLGEPRALKYVPNAEYLASLLMICHTIPAVREAMLMRRSVRENYGEDSDWWRGHAVKMPKIVHTHDGSPTDQDDSADEIISEVQRLMAFLESSDRSYAQPGALAQMNALSGAMSNAVRKFLDVWMTAVLSRSAAAEADDIQRIFSTLVFESGPNGGREIDATVIDVPVLAPEGNPTDLLELLDSLLWATGPNDNTSQDSFISEPANVLVMRLNHTDPATSQTRVQAPLQFYLDKYLSTNASATEGIRRQRAEGKAKLQKIDKAIEILTSWQRPFSSETIDTKLLLSTTRGFYADSGEDEAPSDANILVNGMTPAQRSTEMVQKLDKLIANIEKKLAELNELKESTRQTIIAASKGTMPGLEQNHRYTLVGVATKINVTYLLRSKAEGDEDEIDQDDDFTPPGAQWWRIEYQVNGTGSGASLERSKAPGYDVIRAIELEHNTALLVYASDKALNFSAAEAELPQPLRTFISRDNELYQEEVEAARQGRSAAPPAYELQGSDIPRQSIERDERRLSMDSTRAQRSDDGMDSQELPNYNDERFMRRDGFGLGPDMKQEDPPAHEIRLSPEEDDNSHPTEMVEKAHSPLIPGLGRDATPSDAVMEDASQDGGVGGNPSHIEHVRKHQ